MKKIGINLARMSWPIDYYGEGLTHSETCYTYHDACAIHRLADELEQLRDAAMAVCDSCQDQFSDDYSIRHFTVDEDKINALRKLLEGM